MRIIGFGACMISGYPLQAGSSFFSRFTETISSECETETSIVSLPGTTAPRASRVIRRKVQALVPDLVVLQFGSTDCDCPPISLAKTASKSKVTKDNTTAASPSATNSKPTPVPPLRSPLLFDRLRWFIASLLGLLFAASPYVPLDSYLDAMSSMLDTLGDDGVPVIMLSPFPFAMARTQFWARRFTDALHERFGGRPDVLVVDCLAPFAGCKPKDFLLSDGFHLNDKGHALLGEHLAQKAGPFVRQIAQRATDSTTPSRETTITSE